MSAHKNTLKTAFNDVTGDTIKTGKGSQEKYAENWDAIFGKRVVSPSNLAAIRERLKNKPAPKCKVCRDTRCDYRGVAFGNPPNECEECCVDEGEDVLLPSAVMALDFHDSQPESELQALVRKLCEIFPDELPLVMVGKQDA